VQQPSNLLPAATAQRVADTMFALSTPSRLQILACLRAGPMTVSEIVAAVAMEQSAVSHQLRVLRDHSLLAVQRLGRQRQYRLRDEFVGALIEAALAHIGASGLPAAGAEDPRSLAS
jgi:DNA-binding transcriptional ArsR family regulator